MSDTLTVALRLMFLLFFSLVQEQHVVVTGLERPLAAVDVMFIRN